MARPREVPTPPTKGDDEHEIHSPAQGTLGHLVAAQPGERGGKAQKGDVPLIIGIGDGDGRQAVEAPGREPPMEDAVGGGPFPGFRSARRQAEGGAVQVIGPFDGGPVQQPGADAGAEQHAHPGQGGVGGSGVRAAQPSIAVPAEGQHGQNRRCGQGDPLIEQPEAVGDQIVNRRHGHRCPLRRQGDQQAGCADQKCRGAEQNFVDAGIGSHGSPGDARGFAAPMPIQYAGLAARCPPSDSLLKN